MEKSIVFKSSYNPSKQQIVSNFNGFIVEVCTNKKSKEIAFQLRYRAYRKVNAIPEHDQEMFFDRFDKYENVKTFLVWHEKKPVATIRSCVYSDYYNWQETEGFQSFLDEIKLKFGENHGFIESNRFAVDPTFQGRQSLFAKMLLFRIHALNAIMHDCNQIITCVRPNHIPFYQRFLGMKLISSELKHCVWLKEDVALMAAEYSSSLELAIKRGLPPITQKDIIKFASQTGLQIEHLRKAS